MFVNNVNSQQIVPWWRRMFSEERRNVEEENIGQNGVNERTAEAFKTEKFIYWKIYRRSSKDDFTFTVVHNLPNKKIDYLILKS